MSLARTTVPGDLRVRARRDGWVSALVLAGVVLVQWILFAAYVRREIAPFYPGYWDQAVLLVGDYEAWEQARAGGLPSALRTIATGDHPTGLALPLAGLVSFSIGGAGRLAALAPNFLAFALLQVVAVLVLRRAGGWPAAAMGWGLIGSLRVVYQPVGSPADFRADFAALCLYGVFLGLALRGGAFLSRGWSLAAGVAAAACVWTRFLTLVYVVAALGLFAAVLLVRRQRHPDPAEREAARARVQGAVRAGVVAIVLSAPALWLQRDAIDAHYFHGILGPLRTARAQVVGADRTWGNLGFYPRSLLGHTGPILPAVGLLAAGGLALEAWRRRRAGLDGETSASALLVGLAAGVPLVVLTALTSKSIVVGSIVVAPALWGVALAAARGLAVLRPRVLAWAAAAAIALCGGLVQWRGWHRPLPLDRARAAGVLELHEAVDRASRERGVAAPLISIDHVSDELNAWAVGATRYERTGRLLRARQGLGATIAAVGEADALERARASDFVVLTVPGTGALERYPADKSLAKARPGLVAFCEGEMSFGGRFRIPGRDVQLFVRR
jgi:hypothetical protein